MALGLTEAKQLNYALVAPVGIAGFTSSATNSDNVTATITTALTTAGRYGTSVPLAVGALGTAGANVTQGLMAAPPYNTVPVFLAGGAKQRATNTSGDEIFGLLTNAGAVWTLAYFASPGGVQTAYTWPAATAIDFEVPYLFALANLPVDALVSIGERHVNPTAAGGGVPVGTTLTVTATNTISALPTTPKSGTPVTFMINGLSVLAGASSGINVAGTVVTVTPATLGYSVATTDVVIIEYFQ